ncbi:MAG: ECF transporter S component [Clostridia bacterium]|nr:ECF transporter S component [Clostridia bacterium]
MERVKEKDNLYHEQSDRSLVRTLTYGSLMMALVFIATYSIRIPIPFTQGYIHPGDSMIFVGSLLFGWQFGALVGGFGSAFADILGGYAHWAFPTLIIKGIMGGLVGWVGFDLLKIKNRLRVHTLLTVGAAGIWLAFCLGIKTMLTDALSASPSSLLEEVTETGTMAEFTALVGRVDFWMMVAAIGLPLSMLLLVYYLRKRNGDFLEIPQLLGMLMAGLWMVIGYYIAGGILYGSFIVSAFSIPANIVQFLGGIVIAYPIIRALKKARIPERL